MAAQRSDESTPVVDVLFRENGPIILRTFGGTVAVHGADTGATSVALCRCGSSAKLPLCDGTHKTNGFCAAGEPPAQKPD